MSISTRGPPRLEAPLDYNGSKLAIGARLDFCEDGTAARVATCRRDDAGSADPTTACPRVASLRSSGRRSCGRAGRDLADLAGAVCGLVVGQSGNQGPEGEAEKPHQAELQAHRERQAHAKVMGDASHNERNEDADDEAHIYHSGLFLNAGTLISATAMTSGQPPTPRMPETWRRHGN